MEKQVMLHKKLLLVILLLFLDASVYAEQVTPAEGVNAFHDLKSLYLKKENVTLYYSSKITTLLNQEHPEKNKYGEAGVFVSRPLKTQLLGIGKGYFTVDCDSGGSADPSCTFFQEVGGKLREVAKIEGLHFAMPGNGSVYVEGHSNTMFNVKRKFEWGNGSFLEVKQPFKFVGLDTVTREEVRLFASQEYKDVVAALPKSAQVKVVLNDGEHYLVCTPFGLLGWIRIKDGVQQNESPIKGIYYAGD
jgi:hypothetical protein